MAFRFALAPLLRLRQSIERQRTLVLQESALQLNQAQGALAQLERFLVDAATADESSLAVGCSAADFSSPAFPACSSDVSAFSSKKKSSAGKVFINERRRSTSEPFASAKYSILCECASGMHINRNRCGGSSRNSIPPIYCSAGALMAADFAGPNPATLAAL